MAAYLIAEHVITDAAKFDAYRIAVVPMIAKHGGCYIRKSCTSDRDMLITIEGA